MPEINSEPITNKEIINPQAVTIVTTTFYPRWYPGEIQSNNQIAIMDKIRGDLAIKTVTDAKEKGFQLVVIDGTNNEPFKEALRNLGVNPHQEITKGMSPSRQQGFREASQLKETEVICWVEPEKVSVIRDCLPQAIIPIFKGDADVIIPKRNQAAFDSYPDYQVEFEQYSNHLWNNILRKYTILPLNSPDLDVWFGPRFFRNEKKLVDIFLQKYHFETESLKNRGLKFQDVIKPELWANAIFFPIITALKSGYKVISVDVDYHHPEEQTKIEQNSSEFLKKRQIQQRNIILGTEYFTRMLKGLPSHIKHD